MTMIDLTPEDREAILAAYAELLTIANGWAPRGEEELRYIAMALRSIHKRSEPKEEES